MEWKPIETAPDEEDVICMDEWGDVFSACFYPDNEDENDGEWLQYGTDSVNPKWWLCVVPETPKSQILENMTYMGVRLGDMSHTELMKVIVNLVENPTNNNYLHTNWNINA